MVIYFRALVRENYTFEVYKEVEGTQCYLISIAETDKKEIDELNTHELSSRETYSSTEAPEDGKTGEDVGKTKDKIRDSGYTERNTSSCEIPAKKSDMPLRKFSKSRIPVARKTVRSIPSSSKSKKPDITFPELKPSLKITPVTRNQSFSRGCSSKLNLHTVRDRTTKYSHSKTFPVSAVRPSMKYFVNRDAIFSISLDDNTFKNKSSKSKTKGRNEALPPIKIVSRDPFVAGIEEILTLVSGCHISAVQNAKHG